MSRPTGGSITGSASIDQAICGFIAGAMSTLAMHPLDLLKTKLQVTESRRSASLSAVLGKIGGIRGIYRGVSPNFWGNALSWGLYFGWYDLSKRVVSGLESVPGGKNAGLGKKLGNLEYLTCSAMAGAATAACTNPIWVRISLFYC